VSHRVAQPAAAQGAAEGADIIGAERLAGPLIAVLGKELDRLTAPGLGGQKRIVITASDGHVRAEQRHVGISV
jgi:hypothetical protein